jgi:hypothetical protein
MYRVGITAEGRTGKGDNLGSRNFNSRIDNVDSTTTKVTAFVSPDGNTISLVMFTPTLTDGTNGVDMGTIKIQLPQDFIIQEAVAMRSREDSFAQWEDVNIRSDRTSALVTLPMGNILSLRFSR